MLFYIIGVLRVIRLATKQRFKTDCILHFKEDVQDGVAYIIYDCSIEDLEQRRLQAIILPSAKRVEKYLGLTRTHICDYTSKEAIMNKKRYFSKIHNKHFAIRLAK